MYHAERHLKAAKKARWFGNRLYKRLRKKQKEYDKAQKLIDKAARLMAKLNLKLEL